MKVSVQAIADNRRRLLLLQKGPGETLHLLHSLVDQSKIQWLVLCAVDTVNLWVGTCCAGKRYNAVHPVMYFACDPTVSSRGVTYV